MGELSAFHASSLALHHSAPRATPSLSANVVPELSRGHRDGARTSTTARPHICDFLSLGDGPRISLDPYEPCVAFASQAWTWVKTRVICAVMAGSGWSGSSGSSYHTYHASLPTFHSLPLHVPGSFCAFRSETPSAGTERARTATPSTSAVTNQRVFEQKTAWWYQTWRLRDMITVFLSPYPNPSSSASVPHI